MFLRRKKLFKSGKFRDMIGCGADELRLHLESQFKRGMSWDNYGKVWHVDHVQPLSSLDYEDETQRKIAMHFSNLRPEFAKKNMSLGGKIKEPQLSLRF
jgi:hypothetical protein